MDAIGHESGGADPFAGGDAYSGGDLVADEPDHRGRGHPAEGVDVGRV